MDVIDRTIANPAESGAAAGWVDMSEMPEAITRPDDLSTSLNGRVRAFKILMALADKAALLNDGVVPRAIASSKSKCCE